jgi:hypothetical protein
MLVKPPSATTTFSSPAWACCRTPPAAKPPPPDRVLRPGGQPGVLELEIPHRHGQGARGLAIGMMYDN